MRWTIFIIGVFTFFSCGNTQRAKESMVLKNIITLRTEGMLLFQKLPVATTNSSEVNLSDQLENYYAITQPDFLDICANKEIDISMELFEDVNSKVNQLLLSKSNDYNFCLTAIINNLELQKTLYLEILQDSALENLHLYAMTAYINITQLLELISKRKGASLAWLHYSDNSKYVIRKNS